jgi:hypothetical protein
MEKDQNRKGRYGRQGFLPFRISSGSSSPKRPKLPTFAAQKRQEEEDVEHLRCKNGDSNRKDHEETLRLTESPSFPRRNSARFRKQTWHSQCSSDQLPSPIAWSRANHPPARVTPDSRLCLRRMANGWRWLRRHACRPSNDNTLRSLRPLRFNSLSSLIPPFAV